MLRGLQSPASGTLRSRSRWPRKWIKKAGGVIEISPNGDRVRVTKRTPPDHLAVSNIFDEFTGKIPNGDPRGLLDRVNVVDAKTGALLAQYDKNNGAWQRVR
jgi:hypothetical protein